MDAKRGKAIREELILGEKGLNCRSARPEFFRGRKPAKDLLVTHSHVPERRLQQLLRPKRPSAEETHSPARILGSSPPSPAQPHATPTRCLAGGAKCSLSTLQYKLSQMGIDFPALWCVSGAICLALCGVLYCLLRNKIILKRM